MFCCNKTHNVPITCYQEFNKFKVPRKDNRILDIPLKKMRDTTQCKFVYLKKLLIRLRRRHDKRDWWEFNTIFREHFDIFVKMMNGRWLVSMLDTYADYGNPEISRNALLATTIVNCEKMFKTKDMCFTLTPKPFRGEKRILFASGLDTFILVKADMPRNFFIRLQRSISTTPIIHTMFKRLMKLLIEGDSAVAFLANRADFKSFKHPYYMYLVEEEPLCPQ